MRSEADDESEETEESDDDRENVKDQCDDVADESGQSTSRKHNNESFGVDMHKYIENKQKEEQVKQLTRDQEDKWAQEDSFSPIKMG